MRTKATLLFVISLAVALGMMTPSTDAHAATTLDQVFSWLKNRVTAWDRRINNPNRFRPTQFSANAYRDSETKLVWAATTVDNASLTWDQAIVACLEQTLGSRKGFRLPSADEFMTLIDPANSAPALPAGHPFSIDAIGVYWTATDAPSDSLGLTALTVELLDGSLAAAAKASPEAAAWCVRGPAGAR